MSRLALGLLWLCGATQVVAQTSGTSLAPVDAEEYQRIEAVRVQESAVLDAQEAACYRRFAVNDCLKKVQSARSALQADLRRQETRLHDRERALQGAERLQRAEEKALERKQAESHVQDGPGQAEEKLQAQQGKQAAHAAKAASAPLKQSQALPSGPSAAEQASYRESYVAKQVAAEQKREEIAKRLKEKGSKTVPPLPPPPN